MKALIAIMILPPWLWVAPAFSQDEYEFSLSEVEEEMGNKPYSFGGFLEFEPALLGLDRQAALYKLRFLDRDEKILERFDLGARLEGSYRSGIAEIYGRLDNLLRFEDSEWEGDVTLQEGYLSLKPGPHVALEAGKRAVRWGKGYGFNPVGFVQRPKDPEDPEEALEGFHMLTADWIKSFEGPLKTLAVTPVVIPVTEEINAEFGKSHGINFACKAYMLLWDTDLDLLFLSGDSRTTRVGFDFSRNILPNFEVHGEFAWIFDFDRKSLDGEGNLSANKTDVAGTLLGLRYLTANEITFILEYFHDGTGFAEQDLDNFYRLVDRAYETFIETGDRSAMQRAASISEAGFAGPNPGRDYLYFRASQKEPFDILYLTPALTSIMNLNDRSLSLIPEVSYSPMSNLELRLRAAFLVGSSNTDFGERQNDWRLELRTRLFF
jgi:hypothetical protein